MNICGFCLLVCRSQLNSWKKLPETQVEFAGEARSNWMSCSYIVSCETATIAATFSLSIKLDCVEQKREKVQTSIHRQCHWNSTTTTTTTTVETLTTTSTTNTTTHKTKVNQLVAASYVPAKWEPFMRFYANSSLSNLVLLELSRLVFILHVIFTQNCSTTTTTTTIESK